MNRKLGFTLVELLVTITVVVILLTLTVVNLRGSQATARDEQRKADVAVIAQQLENYHRVGSDTTSPGEYPATAAMATEAAILLTLRDIDPQALRAPNTPSTPISFSVATNTSAPAPNVDAYVYQPLQSTGALCTLNTQECRKFNLFYTLESTPAIQKIISRNQ